MSTNFNTILMYLNKSKALFVLFASMLFTGCENDTLDPLNSEQETQFSIEKGNPEPIGFEVTNKANLNQSTEHLYLDYLENIGFFNTTVVFEKESLIVDNDIVVEYADIKQELNSLNRPIDKQRVSTFPFASVFNAPITYFLDPEIINGDAPLNRWDDAFINAANNWENLPGTDIRFQRVFNVNDADIEVTTTTNDNGIASANLPTSRSRVGRRINVSTTRLRDGRSDVVRISAMMHEIGHTLGLRHTNGDFINEDTPDERLIFNGSRVTCTNDVDDASIMRRTVQITGQFSFQDRVAITTLYRSTNPIITRIVPSINGSRSSRSFRIEWNRFRVPGSTVRIRLLQNLQSSPVNIPRQSPILSLIHI